MTEEILFYGVSGLAAFIVGLSKGGLQLVGILGVPLLALVMPPVAAAALLLPILIVSDMYGLWMYRKNYDVRNLKILMPAMSIGVGIGWLVAKVTAPWMVTLALGLIALIFSVNAVLKRGDVPKRDADVPRGLFWGTLAGFTSFVSHSGGPPFQVYMLPQKLDKMSFIGTTIIVFAYINILKILPFWQLGEFNGGNLKLAAFLSPMAIAGAFVGYWAVRRIPEKLFYRIVEVLLFVVSIKLIYDGLMQRA